MDFTDNENLELIQHMLKRPWMYAQNPGSLEDQFCLLLTLLGFSYVNEYKRHVFKQTGSHMAVAPTKSMEEMANFLQDFWREHKP